jgi:hypothetical protein
MFDAQEDLSDECEVTQLFHIGKQSVSFRSNREENCPIDSPLLSIRFSDSALPVQSLNGQVKQIQSSSHPRNAILYSSKAVTEVQPKEDFRRQESHYGFGSHIPFNKLEHVKTLENHGNSLFSTSYEYQITNNSCAKPSSESSLNSVMNRSRGKINKSSVIYITVRFGFPCFTCVRM